MNPSAPQASHLELAFIVLQFLFTAVSFPACDVTSTRLRRAIHLTSEPIKQLLELNVDVGDV